MRSLKGLFLFLVVALAALPAMAQIDTGAIVGTVTDATGAVVPNVLVTATHVGTNLNLSTQTNEHGYYVFNGLKIGSYKITAELKGFRKTVQTGVELHVQERLAVDLKLQVGEVTQVLSVTDAPPLLSTQSADMGQTVHAHQVVDLPLNGRRYADLALLAGGVLPRPAMARGAGNPSEARFNVNGNFSLQNNFVLDGVDNNNNPGLQGGSPQIIPVTPDALAEFKVQTRTYSAEFGEAQGAVINASIKSGTNSLHGAVYHFLRNDNLDANDFFANRAGIKKGAFVQNQGGFAIGGPVHLGRLYDGRNRTFFFGDFSFLRVREAQTLTGTVPTPAMKRGDFTGLAALTDPGAVIPSQAGCIVNNVIQARCIDLVGQAYANLYPDPTVPGPWRGNNYVGNLSIPQEQNSYDVKVDQKVSDRDSFFARYSYFNFQEVTEPGPFRNPLSPGAFTGTRTSPSHHAVASWTHLFGSSVVNEARFAFGRKNGAITPLAPPGSAADTLGLRGVPRNPLNYGIPTVNVTGFNKLGTSEWRPQYQIGQVWQALDNLSWVKGTHSFKFGFSWKRYTNNMLDVRAPQGATSITNFYVGGGTVGALANLLLGNATTFFSSTPHVLHNYLDGWSFYGQDTWRITPKFSLTYGLRYEYFTPWIDRNNQTSNFDFGGGGRVITARDGGVFERALIHPDRNNFSPRIGFAYNPWKRMTVRGGFGFYYQMYDRIGSESVMQLTPPHFIDVSVGTATNRPPVYFLRNGYPTLPAPRLEDPAFLQTIQFRAQNQRQRTPYVEQTSLALEFELARDLVFEVAGVANYAHKVRKLRNINQGRIVTPGVGPVVFPFQATFGNGYIQFLDTDGNTNFHGLLARVEKRYSNGLSLLASYTLSKVLGNVSDNLSAGPSGGTQTYPVNVYNLKLDYGPPPFDQRQRLVLSYVYELPWGKSKRWLNSGPASHILGGWQINGITTFNSGPPLTATATNNSNTAPAGGTSSRANCLAKPTLFEGNVDRWFNTAAFAPTTPFTFGTCGVGTFYGPGLNNWDFALFKKIPITEGRWLEFRTEFFNLWNHSQFLSPATNVNAGNFAQVSGLAVRARQIQMALKFYF